MSGVHVVRQGECLSSIARAYGFDDWRTLYDNAANAEFKRKRPNPGIIYPGDQLTIPDRNPRTFAVSTGAVHVFKVKLAKARLRILLEVDEPYAYELAVGGQVFTGQTDGKSPIDEPVRADVADGQLTIWPASADRTAATVWELKPGHLDPVDELSGVQGRLANLGYYWGPVDGQPSGETDAAVRRFQSDENLGSANGLDEATRERLTKRHDGPDGNNRP